MTINPKAINKNFKKAYYFCNLALSGAEDKHF